MSTFEYQAYLTKLSDYLSADGFQISRDAEVGVFKADLFGFRQKFGLSFFTAPTKQIICFVVCKPIVDVSLAKTFTESSESVAREKYWAGGMIAQLVFPVIVSQRFDPEVIKFVENFEPKYLSRERARFPHLVLVELGTLTVYHRKGTMMGAIGYKKPISKFVQDALSP